MPTWGLLSDTHGRVHPAIHEIFAGVVGILHAGDVCGRDVFNELLTIAPVYAVAGNCDPAGDPDLPLRRTVRLPFGDVGIAHGHLFPEAIDARCAAMVRAFAAPTLRMVLTGHSHVALDRMVDGIRVVNPGAACPPRFARERPSVALLEWAGEEIAIRTIPIEWKV